MGHLWRDKWTALSGPVSHEWPTLTGWNDTGLSGGEIGRLYAGEAWDAVTSLPRIEQVMSRPSPG